VGLQSGVEHSLLQQKKEGEALGLCGVAVWCWSLEFKKVLWARFRRYLEVIVLQMHENPPWSRGSPWIANAFSLY
jgi:hypothetical protein